MNLLEHYVKEYNKDLEKVKLTIEKRTDFSLYEDWKKVKMQGAILWHNLFK